MKQIRKAAFPVADPSMGFPPATKTSSKDMLPIVDKPLVQYTVEKVATAGIIEMIFVAGRGKRTIKIGDCL